MNFVTISVVPEDARMKIGMQIPRNNIQWPGTFTYV